MKYFCQRTYKKMYMRAKIYIYDGKFEPTDWKITADLLIVAISYRITSLHQQCLRALLDCVDLSNACSLFELSIIHSIPSLYSISLEICVNAAFYILDSEEFNWILPSTVVSIVSHPQLNVPNETFIFYSLWIRATIDNCRNNLDLTYGNIVEYFQPYSTLIEYKDIDENELKSYKNEYLMTYYQSIVIKEERTLPMKRGMKFPLKLPSSFYVHYNTGDIVSVDSLLGQSTIEFSVSESVYLLMFTVVCCYLHDESKTGIDSLCIEDDHETVIRWNIVENNSKVILKRHKRTIYTLKEQINVQEFQFVVHDLIKLCCDRTYCLKIKPSNAILLCPEFKSKSFSNCPVEMHSSTHKSLRKMSFLPSPPITGDK